MDQLRIGVLSTAKIGREKVIPALQTARRCRVTAIASRNADSAHETAERLRIDKAYGSYEELLGDAEVDAVYIPLPNHLHVPWSIKSLEAGKHVLCEKPIGLDAEEARQLVDAAEAHPDLKVMEAFMYRHHPQWQRTRALVHGGEIGQLRAVQSAFSYFNKDPKNVRNRADIGGGGLMDIGCYCISLARFLFDREPDRVSGELKIDADFQTDYLASGVLDFGKGTSTFICSTQMAPFQRVQVFGTEGRIEIEIPFNAPPQETTRIWVARGDRTETITFDGVDQYALQGDHFAEAVLDDLEVPTPLSDAVANMEVIDRLRRSATNGTWVTM